MSFEQHVKALCSWSTALAFIVLAVLCLEMIVAIIRKNRPPALTHDQYGGARLAVVGLATAYAFWTVVRLATVLSKLKEDPSYSAEVIGYVLFWFIVPPVWFFAEYFAFDSGLIGLPPEADKEAHLKRLKDYADFAAKIWAAVVAAGLAIAALSK